MNAKKTFDVEVEQTEWVPISAAYVARTRQPHETAMVSEEPIQRNPLTLIAWIIVGLIGSTMLVIASFRDGNGVMFSPVLWSLAWPVMLAGYFGIVHWTLKGMR